MHPIILSPCRALVSLVVSTALLLGLSGCYSQHELEQAHQTMADQLPKLAQARFSKLKEEVAPPYGQTQLTPALVYEGSSSDILFVEQDKKLYAHRGFDGGYYEDVTLLGRTKKGRYFRVTYRLDMVALDDCKDKLASCLDEAFSPISEEAAKAFVFYSSGFSAQSFERIFGEAPPAKSQPA